MLEPQHKSATQFKPSPIEETESEQVNQTPVEMANDQTLIETIEGHCHFPEDEGCQLLPSGD